MYNCIFFNQNRGALLTASTQYIWWPFVLWDRSFIGISPREQQRLYCGMSLRIVDSYWYISVA